MWPFVLFFYLFLFLAALGPRCCVRAFSSCGEQGLLFIAVCGLRCSGFSCCGAQSPGSWASVVAARGLSSCSVQALGHTGFSSCGVQAWYLWLAGSRVQAQ